MTEVQYQVHNWYHFPWLCGDNICEQHIHNLDVMNWGIGGHPVRAVGMGGRQHPITGPDDGVKFDHFAVDYEYPNGIHVMSMSPAGRRLREQRLRGVRGHQGHVAVRRLRA